MLLNESSETQAINHIILIESGQLKKRNQDYILFEAKILQIHSYHLWFEILDFF